MRTRRQFITTLPALVLWREHAYGQVLCAAYYNGVVGFCDDRRSYNPTGGQSAPSSLSDTPWNTWNDPRLREWDNEILRWKTVSSSTANDVSKLAAELGVAGGAQQLRELQKALESAIASAAGKLVDQHTSTHAEDSFWRQIGDAQSGLKKIQLVNRSLVLSPSASYLIPFAHPSGVVRGTPNEAFIVEALGEGARSNATSSILNLNAVEVASAAAVDATKADPSLTGQPLLLATNGLSTLAILLTLEIALLPDNLAGINLRRAVANAVNPILDGLRGFDSGLRKEAAELLKILTAIAVQPVAFARALAAQLWDVPGFAAAIYQSLKATLTTLISGTAEQRGEVLGRLSVDILTAELGGKAISKLLPTSAQSIAFMRGATDALVTRFVANYYTQLAETVNASLSRVKLALQTQIEILWRNIDSPESFLLSQKLQQADIESLLKIDFLPDGTPRTATQVEVVASWNAILDDSELLESEYRSALAKRGVVVGLDDARRIIEVAATKYDEGQISLGALNFLQKRYATAFELAKAEQIGGSELIIGGAQYDIVNAQYIVQVTVTTFSDAQSISRFELQRGAQIVRTAALAKERGLEAVYWFRKRPPAAIEAYLKSAGINEVWWDLP